MKKSDDRYFIEISKLQEDATEEPSTLIKPFLPPGKKPTTTLSNRGKGGEGAFDYIAITDDFIYFAMMIDKDGALLLRSVKFFKVRDVMAVAFMLQMEKGGPQLRLMLAEGRRMKLIFRKREENRALLQTMAASKFFTTR